MSSLQTRRLGRTGLMVSELGHGLWGMGSWTDADDRRSADVLLESIGAGVTFFDTAWAYGDGHSDALMGRAMAASGARGLVVASKVPPRGLRFPASPSDAYDDVFPPGYVLEVVEAIRRALQVDAIPLLQLHVWDDGWADDPSFAATVEELKSRELIGHVGISLNRWEPWNGIRAVESGLVDTVQVIYNIFDQAPEDELLPACRAHDVGVIARVPLDEGSLGGELTIDTRFPESDWRHRYFGPENLPPTIERVERLRQALPPDADLAEIALRFVLSNPDISTVIPGMRSSAHLQANLAAARQGPLPATLVDDLRAHRWDREVTSWAN